MIDRNEEDDFIRKVGDMIIHRNTEFDNRIKMLEASIDEVWECINGFNEKVNNNKSILKSILTDTNICPQCKSERLKSKL